MPDWSKTQSEGLEIGQESRQDEDVVGKAGVGSGIPDWLEAQSVSPDIGLRVRTSQRLSQRGRSYVRSLDWIVSMLGSSWILGQECQTGRRRGRYIRIWSQESELVRDVVGKARSVWRHESRMT